MCKAGEQLLGVALGVISNTLAVVLDHTVRAEPHQAVALFSRSNLGHDNLFANRRFNNGYTFAVLNKLNFFHNDFV